MNRQKFNSIWVLLSILVSTSNAATLNRTTYITVPWGEGPAQIGHSIPRGWITYRFMPIEGEETPEGPGSFALDPQGNVYVGDFCNSRIQAFDKSGKQIREIQLSREKKDLVKGIDFLGPDKLYVIIGFNARDYDRQQNKLLIYGSNQQPQQEMDLAQLGISEPFQLLLGDHQDIFIQSKMFNTYRLSISSGTILEEQQDILQFWLRTQGHYLYKWDNKKSNVTVYSSQHKQLKTYEGDVRLLGVDSNNNLYVLYKKPNIWGREPIVWLSRLTPEGKETLQLQIPSGDDTYFLDPTRLDYLSPARIGPDGTIYVTGNDTDDQFRIYRYEIKE